MKASIGDVALKAGVSNATVSRAFAHPEKVSENTRKRVLEAADALNFSVSRSAGILKSGRTYRIALLIGGHGIEWFTAEIISGLNDVLRDVGYDLVIYSIEGPEERDRFFEGLPVRGNADAVLVSSFGISPDENVLAPPEFQSSVLTPLVKVSMPQSASMTRKASNSSSDILRNLGIADFSISIQDSLQLLASALGTVSKDSRTPVWTFLAWTVRYWPWKKTKTLLTRPFPE